MYRYVVILCQDQQNESSLLYCTIQLEATTQMGVTSSLSGKSSEFWLTQDGRQASIIAMTMNTVIDYSEDG